MRNKFIEELVSAARINPKIALVVGDLGYSVIEPFVDEFPERFINVGVSEQNMMGMAAGMASEGYHVFAYSIANFPTFRCAEQIRNDVAYHNLPVTIVVVGGGLAYGALGYSHHAVQDYALMRTMPNMTIVAPGDPVEVSATMQYLVSNPGPSYIRLEKAGEPNFHKKLTGLQPGKWIKVRSGSDKKILLTTGAGLGIAMEWIKSPKYADRSVYSIPIWSMEQKINQIKNLCKFDDIITIEDHLQDGGFGSWLMEAKSISDTLECRLKIQALSSDVCGTVGSQSILNALGGL